VEKQKFYHDRRIKCNENNLDDPVLCRVEGPPGKGLSKKLAEKYDGPYVVRERLLISDTNGNTIVNYRIESECGTKRKSKVVHASKLKMYYGPRIERNRATRGRSASQMQTQQLDTSQDEYIHLNPAPATPFLDDQDEQEVDQPLALALPCQENEDGTDEQLAEERTHFIEVPSAPKRGRPRKYPPKSLPRSEDRPPHANGPKRGSDARLAPIIEAPEPIEQRDAQRRTSARPQRTSKTVERYDAYASTTRTE
jgi:hypothetical protein